MTSSWATAATSCAIASVCSSRPCSWVSMQSRLATSATLRLRSPRPGHCALVVSGFPIVRDVARKHEHECTCTYIYTHTLFTVGYCEQPRILPFRRGHWPELCFQLVQLPQEALPSIVVFLFQVRERLVLRHCAEYLSLFACFLSLGGFHLHCQQVQRGILQSLHSQGGSDPKSDVLHAYARFLTPSQKATFEHRNSVLILRD